MKNKLFLICFLFATALYAQVGINTTTPNAQLEIKSSSETTPTNTDGIIIPKINAFPATNPTATQQGMMVYLTTTVGANVPGFYYWDNTGTPTWKSVAGTGGTLDNAYDFGGAGLGKTVTADAGAVLINGTDGLVSTGTFGSGVLAPDGAGTRMLWNPAKAAFRAGSVSGIQWDNINIGLYSTSFGNSNRASGLEATAFGRNTSANNNTATAFGAFTTANGQISTSFGSLTLASGNTSTAFGSITVADGNTSTAFGRETSASGSRSTTFGYQTEASGSVSCSFGSQNTASSYAETALGIGATTYTLSANGINQFGAANATDRLLVVGNAIDNNNNNTVDPAERSDALIILKNGLTTLPSTTNTMIDAASGKALVTKEWVQANAGGGTLDNAYDFGGAGLGKTITADAGAVLINGTDGFVSTGTLGSGAIAPSGTGVKMFWNPRKAAFRVGSVSGTEWNDFNIGDNSVAFGDGTIANGDTSTAFGIFSVASGIFSTAFGESSTASGSRSTAFGVSTIASGLRSTAFGFATDAVGTESTAFGSNTNATGTNSTAFGISTTAGGVNATAFGTGASASGQNATAFGQITSASGLRSTAFGHGSESSGSVATAFGRSTTAVSYGETALGMGNTIYTPSLNGTTQFGTTNTIDRLLVVGNAIDANNNLIIDSSENRDALIILKSGLTTLPSTTNTMIDAASGKAVVTKEWVQANLGGGTLDQAYDFGGAGLGKTITADAGAVLINGTDGFVSTGILGDGAIATSGTGVKMFWNPRKGAFRAGRAFSNYWDDLNIGNYSIAFGEGTKATGGASTAFGVLTEANGIISTAFGVLTKANGENSTSFGNNTDANGNYSTAYGLYSASSGDVSTAFGNSSNAASYGEIATGIGNTSYTPTLNGATQYRTANAIDRLLVVGNAIDANNNNNVDLDERSDALIILKSGLTTLPSTTNTMIDAASGKAVVTKEWVQANTSGTLDDAYDFGGAGLGKTITADAGAVLINGTDGLVSTGTFGSGVFAPAGAGTRMVWNPRKAAFRAGSASTTQWDDVNIGTNSVAFGYETTASGINSTAFGFNTDATATRATAFGWNTLASGEAATAFGIANDASGFYSTAFGSNTTASGIGATAFGNNSVASGQTAIAFGVASNASNTNSTAFGSITTASGINSTAFGRHNTAPSYGETVLGIGATTYTTSVNGATQFRTANANDRLLVVGNAIDTNNNGNVDTAERSDALVILKNGNIGIGTSTPARRLHVATGVSGGTPNAASDFVLESSGPIYQHFLAPSTAETGLLFGSNVGSIRGGVLFNNVNESLLFRTGGNSSRMFITNVGDVGIGVAAPGGQFQLSLDEGRKPGTSTWDIVSDKRLKNINGNYTKGLNEIIQLKPVRYHYKNTGTRNFEQEVLDTEFAGFIAQEVQPLFPDAVKTDDDGYLSFNMHSILVASINAFKELNDKNKQLDNKAAQMEKANLNLELEIQLLKNKLQSQQATNQSILERLAALEKK